ncbi:hypothetical protein FOZ62_004194, partial [Perkinsus olseni]
GPGSLLTDPIVESGVLAATHLPAGADPIEAVEELRLSLERPTNNKAWCMRTPHRGAGVLPRFRRARAQAADSGSLTLMLESNRLSQCFTVHQRSKAIVCLELEYDLRPRRMSGPDASCADAATD